MATPKAPGSLPPPTPATTLFDPFLSGGSGVWGGGKAKNPAIPDSLCEVVAEAALPHLKELAQQFLSPSPGWYGVVLRPAGFKAASWATPQRTAALAGLLPNVLKLQRRAWVYVLPPGTVLVLVWAATPAALVPLVQQMGQLLTDTSTPTPAQLLKLGENPALLTQFIQAEEAALAKAHAAKTQALAARTQAGTTLVLGAPAASLRAGRGKPVVLVVEDDPSTSLLLTSLLEGPVKPVAASSAVAAVQAYQAAVPDVVLLDIGLPDLSGLELVKKLKAGDPTATIIMLTANAYPANVQAALAAGAVGFMAKPFTRDKLLTTLTTFIPNLNKEFR